MTLKVSLFCTVLLIVTWLIAGSAFAELVGQVRVVDGDTIELAGQKIRLHGIDALESKQHCQTESGQDYVCGQLATKSLTELVSEKSITCQGDKPDRYGRLIGKCFVDQLDISRQMVLNGWALAYRTYSHDYVDAENMARQAGAGIWIGSFLPPWDWRRGKRLVGPANTEGRSCVVKANVNSKGQRIYHVLGGQFYDSVNIITEQGDRCFNTEAEAETAGFRRSSR